MPNLSPSTTGPLKPILRAILLTALACALVAASAPVVHAAQKGIADVALERAATPEDRAAIIKDLGPALKTDWVRVLVDWSSLEPTRGTYSVSTVTRLDAIVDGLHAEGIRVLLTTYDMPRWAQDSYWWKHPPAGFAKGPQSFYAIRSGALGDYGDLGQFLAMHFAGRVEALECWNEPNLWYYVYPQRTAGDVNFGAHTYLGMLRAFSKGVARAHTSVKVVAGATAPLGTNDRYRTSPLRFAGYLRSHKAGALFDVYSHHPYTPGGTAHPSPTGRPNNTSTTVTLYNLKSLLRLFPGKPFYLTEYGYNTRPSAYFGGFSVSQSLQAKYLKSAYSAAGRFSQVKLLVWYLLSDVRPASGPAKNGVYSGLETAAGERKPSWYSFRALP